MKEIIFDEIFTNINTYADKTEKVKIGVSSIIDNSVSFISIEISNKINSNNANNGGALGTHFIEQLNDFPNDMFSYESKSVGNQFIQKLRFKKV